MKITYDHEVDALYIRFKETTVTTKHLAEGIAADYDADGYLAGIEILDAMQRLGNPTVFKQITLEDIAFGRPWATFPGCSGERPLYSNRLLL
jgi:uncharacterized protein YuzE